MVCFSCSILGLEGKGKERKEEGFLDQKKERGRGFEEKGRGVVEMESRLVGIYWSCHVLYLRRWRGWKSMLVIRALCRRDRSMDGSMVG